MSFDLTLTFDNGPEPSVTPEVLDILQHYGLRTTFFMIGEKLARSPDLAQRAHGEGHWLGNHTWHHAASLGSMAGPAAEQEISRTQRQLGSLSHASKPFRPVGGGGQLGPHLLNRAAVDLLQRERYSCVLWNSIPRDWAEPEAWVDRALDDCSRQNWTLMVLHDLPTGAMRHLPRFLDAVIAINGRFKQDFPPDCVPILLGQVQTPLTPFVTHNEMKGSSDVAQ